MRILLTRAAIYLAVLILASACGGSTEPSASTTAPTSAQPSGLTRISQQSTVRVCSTGDYRPFTYRDRDGRWSGLDVDMANDLAKRLGVKLEMVASTWNTLMQDLGANCDVAMGGISITLTRAHHALYSAPYLRDGKAAITRCADRSKYTSLSDIDRPGVRVVVNPGGTNAEFDKANIRHAQIIQYPDNNTIFGQLTGNAADVMITDVSEIRWQAKQDPRLCGVSLDHPFTFEQKAYLIPQPDTDLQEWVDQWLNIVQHDGTYAALSQRYLGETMGP